ncbi:MAG: biotin/lipoyl-binding protein [Planctomycetota bacterium]
MSIIPVPPGNPPRPVAPKQPTGVPVRMKIRSDLTFDRVTYQGIEYWVIKEPLGQKYFQFPPPVFFLLKQLDGTKTIEELQDSYHEKFAPKRITRNDLQQLLTRFHQDGLVISEVGGQGAELLKRGQKNRRMETLGQMANILAIRYRGFDPERILNFLNRYTWWIFTKPAVVVTLIAAITALVSVLMNWTLFSAKLPGFEAFFDPRQWYLFGIVLCVTKIFHEFGHGLSCKRLGGECHEIGFMLLVLTPCLYCNVSDSWRLKNKWHRAAIGAAGMYVEVILATIATFVWWFVQPGLVQDICLRIMLVSSISTILFNGNPLLRFDGYYIMSDVLEIPNLYQKSNKALTTLLGRHWLGLEIPDDPLMPSNRPWAFAMFTIAAVCYRWFVLFSIIYFLMTMLEPYNLESVGMFIAVFSGLGMLGMPSYKLFKYMSVPGRMHQVKKIRFSVVLLVAISIVSAILCIPFPHYLRCSMVVMPDKIETIWVQESGMLEDLNVKPGQLVEAGEVIANLKNIDLDIQIEKTKGQILQKEGDLKLAQWQMMNDGPSVSNPMTSYASELAELKNVESDLKRKKYFLKLRSPIAGTVLPIPYEHAGEDSDEIRESNIQPLLYGQHRNISAQRGQRFCEVADMSKWYGYVILSEHQIRLAAVTQETRIKFYSEPGKVYKSKIEMISDTDLSIRREDMSVDPQSQQNSGSSRMGSPDPVLEMVAAYQQSGFQHYAKVPLDQTTMPLKIGLGGQARIFVGNRSLGYRLWWWFNQNFRF